MATIDNSATFHNQPLVELNSTYECSSTASGTVIQMVDVKSGFRVTEVFLAFDDLGTGNTASVGDGESATRFLSAVDTATAAGTATWAPADSTGYVYTDDDTVDVTINSASATGSIRLRVRGYFDFG